MRRRLTAALGVSLALGATLAGAQPGPWRTEASHQPFVRIAELMRFRAA